MNDPKRIIIMALIAIVMLPLGWVIKGAIDSGGEKNARMYNTAIQATESDRFNYAVDSRQGNLLTNGQFTADKPAKFDEMNKTYATVERGKETYEMKTREVCSTDSEGNESCHTETYYEWDYAGGDDVASPTLTLYGRQYPSSMFNFDEYERSADCSELMPTTSFGWFQEKKGCEDHYYYTDSETRYWYRVVDTSFAAGFIANVYDGSLKPINGNQITLKNQSVDQMIERANDYHLGGNLFVVFWCILIIGVMGGIAYAWALQDGTFDV